MNVLFRCNMRQPGFPYQRSGPLWFPVQRRPIRPEELFPHWYGHRTIRSSAPSSSPNDSTGKCQWPVLVVSFGALVKRFVVTTLANPVVLLGSPVFHFAVLQAPSDSQVAHWILGSYVALVVLWHLGPPTIRVAKKIWTRLRRITWGRPTI